MIRTLFPLLFLAFQESVVDAVIKEGKDNSQVMAFADHLTNKIGPRLSSSDNLTKACEWAKAKFEEMGLKNVTMEEWGTFPVAFNRGAQIGKILEPEAKDLHPQGMSWTAGTNGETVAHAVLAPPDAELDKADLKGKWIVCDARPSEAAWKKFDEAGIAGVLRSARADLIVTDGQHRISWDTLPKRVSIFLTAAEYKSISQPLKDGKPVKLMFDIRAEFKKGPVPQYNVYADLPGSEKPEEFVLVGGHIDSWDGATGATDNATGVSTTMEAARLLVKAGAKPKRTIRFILWSGEEQGLFGSREYVKKHKAELEKISAVLVHDGGTNAVCGISATEPMAPLFEKAFGPVMNLTADRPFKIAKVKGLRPGSSDHDSYLAAGVPAFFWHQNGKAQYVRTHHTQYDTFDQIIPEYQKHSAITIAVGAYGIANLDELLPRENLRATGAEERRRRLGIDMDGTTVTTVGEGTPAAKAGLKEGDKLMKLAGKDIADRESLVAAMKDAPKETTLVVERDGKPLELKVVFEH